MKELKRIFSNRRLLVSLLLILLVNGVLCYNARTEQDFGLDLTGPSFGSISVAFDEAYENSTAKVDSKESYQKWLEKYKNVPLCEAADKLKHEKGLLKNIFKISELKHSFYRLIDEAFTITLMICKDRSSHR